MKNFSIFLSAETVFFFNPWNVEFHKNIVKCIKILF